MRHATAIIAATLLALSLPPGAAAQTPSATPTPRPALITVRFDCGEVPWSCGEGPSDIRWQLYEIDRCASGRAIEDCRLEHRGPIVSGMTLSFPPGKAFKIFLGPNVDRSDRAGRSCGTPLNDVTAFVAFHSMCVLNDAACAGPKNWQLYVDHSGLVLPSHKHSGDCSVVRVSYPSSAHYILDWGLPGELSITPTSAATVTAPPPTETLTPTAAPPTAPPTAVAPTTPSPSATAPPATATMGATGTASPGMAGLLLPRLGR